MIDEEAIQILKNMNIEISGTSTCKECIYNDEIHCFRDGKNCQMQAIETVLNLIQKQKEEIEKKDKQIDLMAIAIGNEPVPTEEYCIFRNFNCPVVGGNRDCKECIKQYYERKVENGN